MAGLHLDGLIAIGGEDTLGAAARLNSEHGVPVLGVPKTIDNDLAATDVTFGFDTALQVATEAIDRLHTTAESHHRVMVVEVMGRHAGWIALHSGLAGGADVILIPERPFDIDEVCGLIRRRHARGPGVLDRRRRRGGDARRRARWSCAAGESDEFGHVRLGGIGHRLEHEIEERTGFETRATVLGHVQRGGTPTAFDRVLATRLGVAAIDAAHDGHWGTMPALRGTRIELVPLTEAVARAADRAAGGLRGRRRPSWARARRGVDPPARRSLAIWLAAAAALAAAAPRPGSGIQAGERVDVYVSMPLHGSEAPNGRDVVDAARLALADANGMAGRARIRAVYLDDTSGHGANARWSPAAAAANARRASRGLGGDRLHRRLRLGRDPVLAADHERGAHPPGLAGELRHRPRAAVPRRRGPDPGRGAAHRASGPSAA